MKMWTGMLGAAAVAGLVAVGTASACGDKTSAEGKHCTMAMADEGQAGVANCALQVEGMSCAASCSEFCAKLKSVKNVKDARFDHKSGRVLVVLNDPSAKTDGLVAAVAKLGYKATLVPMAKSSAKASAGTPL